MSAAGQTLDEGGRPWSDREEGARVCSDVRRKPRPAPPPAAAPGGLTEEAMGKLQKLADLRASGVLTEEEFAVQKARILG